MDRQVGFRLSWQTRICAAKPLSPNGDEAMAKGIEGKKQAKKPPTKTMKEKRAEKKAKRAARGY